MENDRIIAAIRKGSNSEVIKQLYKNYPSVRSFIKQHGGNEEDARDMFQEALIILYRNAKKSDFQLTAPVGGYLFNVSKYLWKDELKKKNRKVAFEFNDEIGVAIKDNITQHEEKERKFKVMEKILQDLGEKCLDLLKHFYYKKLSMENIAEIFGYKNVDTAKTQKYKCLERAKKMASSTNLLKEEL